MSGSVPGQDPEIRKVIAIGNLYVGRHTNLHSYTLLIDKTWLLSFNVTIPDRDSPAKTVPFLREEEVCMPSDKRASNVFIERISYILTLPVGPHYRRCLIA